MTVKELKECITNLPDNMEIFLSSDDEGNSYRPMNSADTDGIVVYEDSEYNVYSDKWTADDACMELDEWDEFLKNERSLILW